jgi:hypothetical protein
MNTTRKLILVSASTAMSFLLIMGLNTAFSANPTANPPETGLTPTFNKVTLGSEVDGVQIDSTGLKRTGGTPFLLDSPVARKIQIASGVVLQVLTNLQVDGTAYLKSTEIGSVLENKDLTVFGKITSSILGIDASQLTTTGDITVGGTASITGDLEAKGVSYLGRSEIGKNTFTGAKSLTVYGNTTIGSATYNKNLNVIGTTTTKDLVSSGIATFNGPATFNGNTALASLYVEGLSTLSGDVTLNGKLYSIGGFGTYTSYYQAFQTADAGITLDLAYACPSGQQIISCGYQPSDSAKSWQIINFWPNHSTNSCILKAKNTSGLKNSLGAVALCHDSDR